MTPRGSSSALLPAGALALMTLAVFTQGRDLSAVEVKTVPVAPGLSMLVGAGGNVGVLATSDGSLAVDAQFPELAPKLSAAIAALSGTIGGELRYLINTHWHGDHTGGNHLLRADAAIVAHENVRRRLAGDASIGGHVRGDAPPAALPAITYADRASLWLGGVEVRLEHVAGAHTDGDTVVWFPAQNAVHLGDLFFEVGFPFIDLDSGGDVRGYLAAAQGLLARLPEDVRIIPGHGELATRADFAAWVGLLEECVRRVEAALAAEKELAELQSDGLLDDLRARGDWAFIQADSFLETLVTGLSK
jgi:glyoxylase-like metal-dependent hydrolase (beta-lactamase superfamily II)